MLCCFPGDYMEFTLYYRGELKSNRGAEEKHEIRRHFHRQLRILWTQRPLSAYQDRLLFHTKSDQSLSVIRTIGRFRFAPLVAARVALVAEMRITILRPEAPGSIVAQGGDIDNRLKTLLDALEVPSEPNALPVNATPGPEEDPFFCLLEDDALITRIDVATDRLLEPGQSATTAVVLVHVTTKQLEVYMGTIGLA